MAVALLFSGQGMQHPQMLPWLRIEHPLLLSMQQQLGIANWRAALQEASWASVNRHAQVLLTATSLAAWEQLHTAAPGCTPRVVAGYSVGELAACSVAGVFDPLTALHLAGCRAAAMDAASVGQDFAMLAVSGLPLEYISSACVATGTALAIHNGPDSVVCAGPRPQLQRLEQMAYASGGHCTWLSVQVASHTHWMQSAARDFAADLSRITLNRPCLIWLCNSGQWARDGASVQQALVAQLTHPVQWHDCMQRVYEYRPQAVLEIGPGQGLSSMWNRRYPDIPSRSADAFQTQAALLRWLETTMAHPQPQ